MIADGFVIGSRDTTQMQTTEFAAAEIKFTLPSLPLTAEASFFWYENNSEDTDYVDRIRKGIEINGTSVVDESVRNEQWVERRSLSIGSHLQEGENTIRFQISVTLPCNIYHQKLLQVFGLSVTVDGQEISTSSPTFSKYEEDAEYALDSGAIENNIDGRIIAASSADYSITDSIDGIMAFFTPIPTLYDKADHQALLSTARSILGTGDLIAGYYARMWGWSIDPGQLVEQTRDAAEIADGVLFWNFPLALNYLTEQKGIFAQRTSDNAAYSLLAYFPGQQPGFEGWYQKFTCTQALTGMVTVEIKDNMSSSSSTQFFRKEITSLETGTVYYSDDIEGDEGAETVSIDLGSTPTTLVLSLSETFGVGNLSVKVWFEVTDSGGQPLGTGSWTFDSGTYEAWMLELFSGLKETLLELQSRMNP
jgi:hypothetical protein